MPEAGEALLVIDVQQAFDDPSWGRRDKPACEQHIGALTDAYGAAGAPVVVVRHDSAEPGSTLAPDTPGNAFKPVLDDVEPDLLVVSG